MRSVLLLNCVSNARRRTEKAISDMVAMGGIDFAQVLDVKDDDRQYWCYFGRSA